MTPGDLARGMTWNKPRRANVDDSHQFGKRRGRTGPARNACPQERWRALGAAGTRDSSTARAAAAAGAASTPRLGPTACSTRGPSAGGPTSTGAARHARCTAGLRHVAPRARDTRSSRRDGCSGNRRGPCHAGGSRHSRIPCHRALASRRGASSAPRRRLARAASAPPGGPSGLEAARAIAGPFTIDAGDRALAQRSARCGDPLETDGGVATPPCCFRARIAALVGVAGDGGHERHETQQQEGTKSGHCENSHQTEMNRPSTGSSLLRSEQHATPLGGGAATQRGHRAAWTTSRVGRSPPQRAAG